MSEHNQEKCVRVAGFLEFLAEVGNDASDAESHFEEVVGGGLAKEVTSGVDKAPADEKEEEEDLDTHFKRKKKACSCGPP